MMVMIPNRSTSNFLVVGINSVFPNFDTASDIKATRLSAADLFNNYFDQSVTWADAEWLAKIWNGPLIIKGLLSVDDVKRAAAIGAAVVVSNHGGRQLDGTPAPIDCVKEIRDAVGGDLEIILDGGVRRGTHVVKALAAGANACSIGRPYLYGLAAGGEAGVDKVLQLLTAEIERAMTLLGVSSVAGINGDYIRHR
jgi:L-lactate dehydrogenase (cytochrome)